LPNEQETIEFPSGAHRRAFDDLIRVVKGFKAGLDGVFPPGAIEWLESTIDLTSDSSTAFDGKIKISPWQIMPILSQLIGGCEVDISAPEQSGKSMSWKLGAIYKARFMGGSMLTVYEERDKAALINKRTFHPLLMCVDEYKQANEQDKKFLVGNRYNFVNGSLEYLGAGADVTSQSFKFIHADELDTWPLTTAKRRSQVANLRKRWRTFQRQGLGSFTKCSSIKGTFTDSTMWNELKNSNMGVYHLKCLGCGKLTINSTCHELYFNEKADRWSNRYINGLLKYDLDDFGDVDAGSCRVVCPDCKHEHSQNDLADTCKGAKQYVYLQPRIKKHHGYIIGGLACDRALTLAQICKAYNELETCNDFERKRTLYNSYFGIPLEVGIRDGEMDEILESHCIDRMEYPEKFTRVLMAADSQLSPFGWYYVIRGFDKDNNNYLLDHGFICRRRRDGGVDRRETINAFGEKCRKKCNGHKIDYVLADAGGGGDATEALKELSKRNRHIFMYKGGSFRDLYTVSKTNPRLLNCSAKMAADELLYLIYHQEDKESGNYWYLPEFNSLSQYYIDQVLNVAPENNTTKDKEIINDSQRYDYFDCEKMLNILSRFKRGRKGALRIGRVKIRR